MIGRFTTRKFEDRAAFERRTPHDTHVSYNRFTQAGLEWMWNEMLGNLRQADGTLNDHLGSARLLVGNGSEPTAFSDTRLSGDQTAQVDSQTPVVERDGESETIAAVFRGVFGENEAIFDWQERGVVTAQGVLIDRAVRDQGRKVLGAVWELEARLLIGNPGD